MIAYALVGAISAVVELASVAVASAYVAQISRRRLREKQQSWVSRNQLESQVTSLSVCSSVCLFVCLSVRLSVCLLRHMFV
jgi:hypothetical protein